MKLGCKRAYLEGRDALRQEHQAKLTARDRWHHAHHGGRGGVHINNKSTKISNVNKSSVKNSNNRISSVKNTVRRSGIFMIGSVLTLLSRSISTRASRTRWIKGEPLEEARSV